MKASPVVWEKDAPAAPLAPQGGEKRPESAHAPFLRRLKLYGVGVLLVPFAFFLLSLHNLYDYGETSDEAYDKAIGHFYYDDFPKTGLANIESRLDPLQRNYGPLWDLVAVWSGDILKNKTHWVTDPIAACHVSVVVVSTLLLVAVFLIGATAYGPACGYASQLALLLMPQFIGHSQNNLKDQPVSLFFALAMLAFLVAVRRGSLWRWALAGCVGGMAYAVKINGVFVLPVVGLWCLPFLLREPRKIPTWILRFAVATAAYIATVPLLWPYYRVHTLAHFPETIRAFRDHVFNEIVFYMGLHAPARSVPWHFPFVMFGVNTPLLHLSLAILALLILAKLLAKRRLEEARPLLLFAVWFFVPIIAQVASRVPRCDGVRHYLYLLPALALLAGTAVARFWLWAEERKLGLRVALAAVLALSVLLLARTLAAYHPYEVVFFNSLVGGPAGARQRFELDYSGTSLLQASRWIEANLPTGSRLWFTQPGIHRFRLSYDRFRFVGPDDRPNYKISLPRGMVKTYDNDDDYLHPRRKPIYEVAVKGAPILQIFEIEENRDIRDRAVLTPSAAAPLHLLPGLIGNADIEGRPRASLPPLERLFIDPRENPYNGNPTKILAGGYLRVSNAGSYVFELSSDDCATIWLGGEALVTNVSGLTSRKTVLLSPGLYEIRLKYRNEIGDAALRFSWLPPGAREFLDVAAPNLLHDADQPELPRQ